MTSIEQWESKRKHFYRKLLVIALVTVLTYILAGFLKNFSIPFSDFSVLLPIVFTIILLYISSKRFITKEEEHKLFQDIVATEWGGDVHYDSASGFTEDEIRSLYTFKEFTPHKQGFTSLLETIIKYTSEDKVMGLWEGIDFEVADADIRQITGKNEVIIFHGIIVKAHYPFDFDGTTWVHPKDFLNKYTSTRPGEKVRLESPDFMNRFEVFTSNQLGARLALQTDIMEIMLKLEKLFPGVRFIFHGRDVWIAVPTGLSWLDLSYTQPIPKQIESTRVLLQDVGKLMKQLKLNHIGNRVQRR